MRVLDFFEAMKFSAVVQGDGLDWEAQLGDSPGHGREIGRAHV